jgi:serine/threonine-protein kinase
VAEVAATLGVGAVLQGSVRRVGNRVRIVAQLEDAETSRQLWADSYDHDLTDIFQIQCDVALQIAAALRAELTPGERLRMGREPTTDLQAWRLYVLGRHQLNQYTAASIRKALDYFEEAVERDPGFALAHAGIARAYVELVVGQDAGTVPPAEALARGRAAASRALVTGGALGEAHAVEGLVLFVADRNWGAAEDHFRIALDLSPNAADVHAHYAWLCWSLGRYAEAEELARHANELDPLAHRSDLATVYLRAGRFDEALREAERIIEFDPGFARGYSARGWALIRKGDLACGLADIEKAVELTGGSSLFLCQLGQAYAESGRRDDALAILERLEAPGTTVAPYHLAYLHAGLGNAERALDLLEQAAEEGGGGIYGVAGSFLFQSLHGHPRFTTLLHRLNLEGAPAAVA